MALLKRQDEFERPVLSNFDQTYPAGEDIDAANDDEGGEGQAHLWAEYSRLSLEWQAAHPGAAGTEVEAALSRFARYLGI